MASYKTVKIFRNIYFFVTTLSKRGSHKGPDAKKRRDAPHVSPFLLMASVSRLRSRNRGWSKRPAFPAGAPPAQGAEDAPEDQVGGHGDPNTGQAQLEDEHQQRGQGMRTPHMAMRPTTMGKRTSRAPRRAPV